MKTLKFKITGTTGLMLNNAQTVNPFNEFSKRLKPLTSKRIKTEDDLEEISHIKFLSCFYMNGDVYVLPSNCIEQSIVSAAKENKLGKKFERSFRIFNDAALQFPDSNKTPEELYKIGSYVDIRAVGIKNVKITTTRVLIQNWSCEVEAYYDETQLEEKEIMQALDIAGERYGVGTYRRLYGRFNVKKIK